MNVTLPYGHQDLEIRIPETPGFQGVFRPHDPPAIPSIEKYMEESLCRPIDSLPLARLAQHRRNACIIISDITRPVPNRILLPPILKTLEQSGIDEKDIVILIATGIHRPNEGEELIELVGREIVENYRIVNHRSRSDEEMIHVGDISIGVPVVVNRLYVEADLKILTGFIEPHMWAGFSGGRKSILPGISSMNTLHTMHGPAMVAHPDTRYGVLKNNPLHDAALETMELTGADFMVNVTLNSKKQITEVFAGHPVNAHEKGCRFLSRYCIQRLKEPLDFILTTNSGAPLDCNLYQTAKGITGAAPVVKDNGIILIASACYEGVGSAEYEKVLDLVDTPERFIHRIMAGEFFIPDQWCAQETVQVMLKHPIWLYSDGISLDKIRKYHFVPATSIEESIGKLLHMFGTDACWAVVPDGPNLILQLNK